MGVIGIVVVVMVVVLLDSVTTTGFVKAADVFGVTGGNAVGVSVEDEPDDRVAGSCVEIVVLMEGGVERGVLLTVARASVG